MAPNSRDHGNDDDSPSTDPPIPLQEFSRPPEAAVAEERGRSRAGGGFLSRHSLRRGSLRNYERVSEVSPASSIPHRIPHISEPEDATPVEDPGSFAQAISSVGLSFDGPPLHPARESRSDLASDLDSVPLDSYNTHDTDNYLGITETYEDTTPLTDHRYLQPISGASGSGEQQDGQSNEHTTRSRAGLRLGDDLPNLESGLGGRRRGSSSAGDRSRSLSPGSGSALQRASSMVKSMSHRVVNLSNAPEVIEESIRREESWNNSRMEEPPQLPAMPDYAHDTPTGDPVDDQPTAEKRTSSRAWRSRNNPLRGRSLGIVGPDNPVRLWLCDILVNPFTEPIILLVIILQTILLTVESAKPVWDSPRTYWGKAPLDYVYFCIFVIFTLELIAKILVSGLIMNPVEYSTLNRNLGFKKALAERGKNLITPQRQFSKKPSVDQVEPQASIIRTFTGLNQLEQEEEVVDDPLQSRRVRLAHRAFLRHSFNRLDFVAVMSFWISFLLGLIGVETREQIFVFRMLSCLRILRLLALTNGTSVSSIRFTCYIALY